MSHNAEDAQRCFNEPTSLITVVQMYIMYIGKAGEEQAALGLVTFRNSNSNLGWSSKSSLLSRATTYGQLGCLWHLSQVLCPLRSTPWPLGHPGRIDSPSHKNGFAGIQGWLFSSSPLLTLVLLTLLCSQGPVPVPELKPTEEGALFPGEC